MKMSVVNATLLALWSDSSLPLRLIQNGLEHKNACADLFFYMVSQQSGVSNMGDDLTTVICLGLKSQKYQRASCCTSLLNICSPPNPSVLSAPGLTFL